MHTPAGANGLPCLPFQLSVLFVQAKIACDKRLKVENRRAAQARFHSRTQLFWMELFGHVIVGAFVEAFRFIVDGILAGQNAETPEFAQKVEHRRRRQESLAYYLQG